MFMKFGKKPLVDDEKQADGALAEMAAIDRKLGTIAVDMNESISVAKEKAEEAAAPLKARRKVLNDELKKWASMNKAKLFASRKSLNLAFGVLGFRGSTAIHQMRGIKVDETLARLKKFNFTDGIRVVSQVDKEAMDSWPEDRLALVGLRRVDKDTFFCTPAQEKITTK